MTVIVDESTGELKQCVKADSTGKSSKEDIHKDIGEKGKKYTAKDLENVTRMCVLIENSVGMKTIRLEDIGVDVKKLIQRKGILDEKIEKSEKEYRAIDKKGIDLSSEEFRQKCYLLHRIGEMINERCSIKKKMADYTVETSRVKRELYQCEGRYKTNIYLKEKIMKFLSKQ